jgi:hypothetical protein
MKQQGIISFVFVVCFGIAACVQLPVAPGAGKKLACLGAQCRVQVSVDCFLGIFCRIAVDSDTIDVPRGNSPVLEWEVVTPGYAFADNGIAINDAGDEITCRPGEGTRQRFVCNNKHTKPGTYKYTIRLTGWPAVLPLDPWIVNG